MGTDGVMAASPFRSIDLTTAVEFAVPGARDERVAGAAAR